MTNKIEIKDWEAYKKFFRVVWGVRKKMIVKEMEKKGLSFPENVDPRLFLEPRSGETKTQAFSGLKQAIQDTLEDTREMNITELREIDELLKREGAPSLSDVRSIIWNEIPKIIKRRKIKNETEFYLIKEKLVDVSSNEFTEKERAILNKLLDDYEFGRRGQI